MTKLTGGESKNTLYCSFCGKSQHEVRKLIAGPTVFICDECVNLCADIIRDEVRGTILSGDFSDLEKKFSVYLEERYPGDGRIFLNVVEFLAAKLRSFSNLRRNLLFTGPQASEIGKTIYSLCEMCDFPVVRIDGAQMRLTSSFEAESLFVMLSKTVSGDLEKMKNGIIIIENIDRIIEKSADQQQLLQEELNVLIEGCAIQIPTMEGNKLRHSSAFDTSSISYVGITSAINMSDKPIIADGKKVSKAKSQKSLSTKLIQFGFLPELIGSFDRLEDYHSLKRSEVIGYIIKNKKSYLDLLMETAGAGDYEIEDDALIFLLDDVIENGAGLGAFGKSINGVGMRLAFLQKEASDATVRINLETLKEHF